MSCICSAFFIYCSLCTLFCIICPKSSSLYLLFALFSSFLSYSDWAHACKSSCPTTDKAPEYFTIEISFMSLLTSFIQGKYGLNQDKLWVLQGSRGNLLWGTEQNYLLTSTVKEISAGWLYSGKRKKISQTTVTLHDLKTEKSKNLHGHLTYFHI